MIQPIPRKRTADERATEATDDMLAFVPARLARGHGKSRGPTAAERVRMEHERYVNEIYPRLTPDQKPRLIVLDPDTCAPVAGVASVGLGEVCFGCSGYVPFVSETNDFTADDHPFLECLNFKSWGYRDGCTAIVLGRGTAAHAAFANFFQSFAVFRGGKPFDAPPEVLFVLPHWTLTHVRGTLSASSMYRSVELGVALDQALRILGPTGPPLRLRDDAYYSRFADLRIVVRFADSTAGEEIVRCASLAAGTVIPPMSSTDIDDEDGATRGASARLSRVADIPISTFFGTIAALGAAPVRWYCVLVTDPKVHCSTDLECLARGLVHAIPRYSDGDDEVRAMMDEPAAIMQFGYHPGRPPRDARSCTTQGILDSIKCGQKLNPSDCEAWIATSGDTGVVTIVTELIAEVVKLQQLEQREIRAVVQPLLQTCAAFVGLRILWHERLNPANSAGLADMLAALRMLRAVPLQDPLLVDLTHLIFYSLVRCSIANIC